MKSKNKANGYKFICIQSSDGPQLVPYKLERSGRLKRMRIQIDSPEYVTLKMPLRMAEKHGTRFLQEHGEWICQSMAELPRVPSLRSFLQKRPKLSLYGRWHRLQVAFQNRRAGYQIDEEAKSVTIFMHPDLPPDEQLVAVLRRIAKDCLPVRLQYWADEYGLKPHGVTIRDQKSRWGSCSETGGISLNWRLILVAPKLQDYVLLHELAHIRHFDHSSEFHAHLESFDPKARVHAKRLHDEAARVFALGRAMK